MDFFISVIVPVYNTKQYLPACLDSILNQTYRDMELIIVDDGSTDGSLEICMSYRAADARVRVVQQNHGGLVAARKRGVREAQGDYCIFADSDDWVSEKLLETIVPMTENGSVDIVNYNITSVCGNRTTDWMYTIPDGIYEQRQLADIYPRMMFDFAHGCPGIIQSLCTKLMRKSILQAAIETVDNRITLGEDAATVYQAMLTAGKIAVTSQCLYYYRDRDDSMSVAKDMNIFLKISYFQQYMSKIFANYQKEYQLERQLRAYLLYFAEKGMRDNFSLTWKKTYRIPLSALKRCGRRIVLYGAGNVGTSYYRQLSAAGDIEVAAWVDRKAKPELPGCRIQSVDALAGVTFDTVLIAVLNRDTAEEIKADLSKFASGEQIIWEKPQINWWEREIDI